MAQSAQLQRLLDICDEIRSLRRRLQAPGLRAEAALRLKRRSKQKLRRLADDLARFPFVGTLKALLADCDERHFLLLATLLRRYLRSELPAVEGRALLAAVFDSSFELLRGLELLQEDGVLRRNGLLVLESDEDDTSDGDLLESRFRLSDTVIDGFLEELGLKERGASKEVAPYANQYELLVDLRIHHNLHRARAKRLFSHESWWRLDTTGGAAKAQRALERRIRQLKHHIVARVELTPNAAQFPILQFRYEHKLSAAEFMIVLHLIFLELLEGNPYADVVSLMQLVSSDEVELLHNRSLLVETSKLRRLGVVELDQMLEGRELTGEAHLANWVVERLLGEVSQAGRPIDADERLEFHLYLKKLSSSKFLNDLDV